MYTENNHWKCIFIPLHVPTQISACLIPNQQKTHFNVLQHRKFLCSDPARQHKQHKQHKKKKKGMLCPLHKNSVSTSHFVEANTNINFCPAKPWLCFAFPEHPQTGNKVLLSIKHDLNRGDLSAVHFSIKVSGKIHTDLSLLLFIPHKNLKYCPVFGLHMFG